MSLQPRHLLVVASVPLCGMLALAVDEVARGRHVAVPLRTEPSATAPAPSARPVFSARIAAAQRRPAAVESVVSASSAPEDDRPPVEQYLHGRWEAESRDPAWADGMEAKIRGLLDGRQVALRASRTTECRASLCRLVIGTTSMSDLLGLREMQADLGHPVEVFNDGAGEPHVVAYIDESEELGGESTGSTERLGR